MKAPCHLPLPSQRTSTAENVSIWWCPYGTTAIVSVPKDCNYSRLCHQWSYHSFYIYSNIPPMKGNLLWVRAYKPCSLISLYYFCICKSTCETLWIIFAFDRRYPICVVAACQIWTWYSMGNFWKKNAPFLQLPLLEIMIYCNVRVPRCNCNTRVQRHRTQHALW